MCKLKRVGCAVCVWALCVPCWAGPTDVMQATEMAMGQEDIMGTVAEGIIEVLGMSVPLIVLFYGAFVAVKLGMRWMRRVGG